MRIQKRKNIVDIVWGFMPATVFCLKHFKFWKEGAYYPQACEPCIEDMYEKP